MSAFRSLAHRQAEILRRTEVTTTSMVPEIKLHLITPQMEVWREPFKPQKVFICVEVAK